MHSSSLRKFREIFHQRLTEAFTKLEVSQAELCRKTGIDRSTLTQLLKADDMRLPRADTVAALAEGLNVSADWLLGLSNQIFPSSQIVQNLLRVESIDTYSPIQEPIYQWHSEASDQKIRYVPQTLPDQIKTLDMIVFEYREHLTRQEVEKIMGDETRQQYNDIRGRDFEVCCSIQTLDMFFQGAGIWADMELKARKAQIEHMIKIVEESYPDFRLYFYDPIKMPSPQLTIFGRNRAAIGVGNLYFSYTTREHVETLIGHFNQLIRNATVKAHESVDYLQSCLNRM